MDASQPTICFAGDLSDPWVVGLQTSIAHLGRVRSLNWTGEITDRLLEQAQAQGVLVLHCVRLSQAEAARIDGWRSFAGTRGAPPILLCYSPYVRYAELERASRGVDLALPEATAGDILPRHVLRLLNARHSLSSPGAAAQSFPVWVKSDNHELHAVLGEICTNRGLQLVREADCARLLQEPSTSSGASTTPVLTVWDVPVLHPNWPETLRELTRNGPVVALLGFADRATVGQARASGASACLDLPLDAEDLVYVIEAVNRTRKQAAPTRSSGRTERAHKIPPAPASRSAPEHRAPRETEQHPPPWSRAKAKPTITKDRKH
jgi:hypothetical protein